MFSIKREIFTFTKAQGSALFATLVDYAVLLFLDKVCGWDYLLATFCGAVTGGVLNCFVNYNFAFRGNGRKKWDVAWRYLLMMCGSIILNTIGTGFFKEVVGIKVYYARPLTSLLVAICWNYMLQRTFVFKRRKLIEEDIEN